MSFCHECGEKVANEDVFCPYCGISLKPVLPVVEDLSDSDTIVGYPAPALSPASPAPVEPPPTPFAAESDLVNVFADAQSGADDEPSPAPAIFRDPEPIISEPPPAQASLSAPPSPKSSPFDVPPPVSLEPPIAKPIDSPAVMARHSGGLSDSAASAVENREPEAPTPDLSDSAVLKDLFAADGIVVTGENENSSAAAVEVAPKAIESPVSETGLTDLSELISPPNEVVETPLEPLIEESPAEVMDLVEEKPAAAVDSAADFSDVGVVAPELSETVDAGISSNDITDAVDTSAEVAVADEVPSETAGSFPVAADFSFDQTLPPMPAPLAVAKVEEVEVRESAPAVNFIPAEPEVSISEPPVQPTPEPVAVPAPALPELIDETPIAMPLDEPPALTPVSPEPQLDSVRIIEQQAIEAAAKRDESDAPRSHTVPNMAGPDTDGRKANKLQPLAEGTVLNGRYEIVRKIGGGGMGAVYLANDRNLGGVLRAVKEMVQSYIESEQQDKAVNDFKRESLLLTTLDHPAIPTIFDYFFDEKEARFYLVMRYISGGDLAGRLRAAPEGRIDEKLVTEWAIQIADVLDYLHNHEPPIVYRDLKPANVMIDGNSGRVMLIDFGIARWVNKEEKGVTAVGTMGYAPPELFSGNVEARSDIYSLGSTMFHLLTGADPQSNPLLIFDFQKNPRPRQINSVLTDQIEQILMRAVEYNADLRFRTAAEMRDALRDHLANLTAGRVSYGVAAAPANRAFSEQQVFCGFCGKQIVATDVFCAYCGAQQPIAQQQAAAASAVVAQPLTPRLTIMATGELEPSVFKLEKPENLLGRRDPMSNIFPEVDLSKYDPQTKISRRHARVWRDAQGFRVEDLGSSNGTTLIVAGGDPIRLLPHQPHVLSNGDRIKLGDTLLHFTVG